jgi:hypothetical protein
MFGKTAGSANRDSFSLAEVLLQLFQFDTPEGPPYRVPAEYAYCIKAHRMLCLGLGSRHSDSPDGPYPVSALCPRPQTALLAADSGCSGRPFSLR